MPRYSHILITGGAGFVGSNLALSWAREENIKITCLDNLHRRGSELSLSRLKAAGINFVHGDIRIPADLENVEPFDLLIECSAEPSVHAGYNSSPSYVVDTNLQGTINCLETARKHQADVIYLSTSRVYPIRELRQLPLELENDRYIIPQEASGNGWSASGITTDFSLAGTRSIYGATKLCSELIIDEYRNMYGLRCIVNRCGVLSGPWQMGKVDQGFISLWVSRHYYRNASLAYMGFEGTGHQVRDILHIEDLFDLIRIQTTLFDQLDTFTFNVGGGPDRSVSLKELTLLCQAATGHTIDIKGNPVTREADIPWFITDIGDVTTVTNWHPSRTVDNIIEDVLTWIDNNSDNLSAIFT